MFNGRVGRPGSRRIDQAIHEAKIIETELDNIDEPEPAEELPPDFASDARPQIIKENPFKII